MQTNLTKTEVAEIQAKVQSAYTGLSKAKRDELFPDLLDVMVFFRGLSHDADGDEPAKVDKVKAA